VLYVFLTDVDKPWQVVAQPGGHLIAPIGEERVGDVSNVVFSNGWVAYDDGRVLIYYASSDTRLHVAETTLDRLLYFVRNAPEDSADTHGAVRQRLALIELNQRSKTGDWQ
jgi:4-O-beta-D-mannosyl-D-glucose phosphorylase